MREITVQCVHCGKEEKYEILTEHELHIIEVVMGKEKAHSLYDRAEHLPRPRDPYQFELRPDTPPPCGEMGCTDGEVVDLE